MRASFLASLALFLASASAFQQFMPSTVTVTRSAVAMEAHHVQKKVWSCNVNLPAQGAPCW